MLYSGKRYDIGKLEWLKAYIELVLKDKELGKEFKEWILKKLKIN